MNEALRILESNELMRHIILFKIYIESNGTPLKNIEYRRSIEDLYGESFDRALLINSKNYLTIKGLISRTNHLTYEGLDYFENWIKSFENLTEQETEILNKELPEPIFDFLSLPNRLQRL